ncbi:MAG: c-type cytochrome biogenesis protein CcmI [Pseudomonadales bacterium]|nr:c-type cytochrome biogenesis protein CcmI [Pseudomonadales bacterium]
MNVLGFLMLAALAALFVFAPRLGVGRTSRMDARRAQQELLNERLDEIDRDRLDPNKQGAQQSEIAVEIAADLLHAREPQHPATARIKTSTLVMLAGLLPVMAGFIFFALVDLDRNELKGAEVVLNLNAEQHGEELAVWRTKLETYIAKDPGDAQIQYLLGQTNLKVADYGAAAAAFTRANQSSPDDVNIKIFWLQARFLSARGKLDATGRQLAQEILQTAPNLPVVLEILALDAVAAGDAEAGVGYLNRAMSGIREPSRVVSLSAAITELRKRFELPGIDVQIQAEGDIPHSATLFVIARPIGGGMPFAVVRRPAVLLPLNVRLDDVVSMSEARKLTAADTFEVVVRLSVSGQAMAQEGDWQWLSEPMRIAEQLEPVQAHLSPP